MDFPAEGLKALRRPKHSQKPLHQLHTWASTTHGPAELRSSAVILPNHPVHYCGSHRHQLQNYHRGLV